NFENGFGPLVTNCWQFTNMMYATNSAYVINGNGSVYSEPPVNSDSIRNMRTPLLNVGSSITVSFVYRLSNNLTGQSTRTVTIDLVDNSGNVVQNLSTFNIANDATSAVSFNQTFNVTTPGIYRLSVSLSGSNGNGSVRVSLDDLYESATLVGCAVNGPLAVKLMSFSGNKNENK